MIENKRISKWFDVYQNVKKDEFFLEGDIRADVSITPQGFDEKFHNSKNGISTYPNSFLNILSPNRVDSSFFWKKATEAFPLASVCYHPGCKDKIELNDMSLKNVHAGSGSLGELIKILDKNPSAKILEIGPGHGAVTNYIALNYNIKNYYAIDVNPLFKFKRLYKTDGKTIPDKIPNNLDVIYAVNVFQHLSPRQRLSYYTQAKKKLAVGGKFIFSMFVVDSENENLKFKDKDGNVLSLFGVRDKQGNCYASFFTQFTKCSRVEELEKIFKNLNMSFEVTSKMRYNGFHMVATKL